MTGLLLRGRQSPLVGACVVVAFAARLAAGLPQQVDGDEAVEGIAAIRILHGHPAMIEASARYLGALESYLLAPIVLVLGPSRMALRVGMAVIGAAAVMVVYLLGRYLWEDRRAALALAAIATVFPLFAVSFAAKTRTYGTIVVLEPLVLLLAWRLALGTSRRDRDWAIFGLVGGLAFWNHPLLGMAILLGVAAIVARRADAPGAFIAGAAALLGYVPWLAYNLTSRLGSLRHLYSPLSSYSVSTIDAAKGMLRAGIPIFTGFQVDFCGPQTVTPALADILVALAFAGALYARRDDVQAVVARRWGEVSPAAFVLALGPLAFIAVTVRFFNGVYCEPRYFMPFAPPLTVAVGLCVVSLPRAWRAAALVALVAWIGVSAVTLTHQTELFRDVVAIPGANQRADLEAATRTLLAQPPQAVWAAYALGRPIQYLSGDRLVVGAYGSYVSFIDTQEAALRAQRPAWLFLSGDPQRVLFEAYCRDHSITFTAVAPGSGLVLYTNLSARVQPADLGLKTQTPTQAR